MLTIACCDVYPSRVSRTVFVPNGRCPTVTGVCPQPIPLIVTWAPAGVLVIRMRPSVADAEGAAVTVVRLRTMAGAERTTFVVGTTTGGVDVATGSTRGGADFATPGSVASAVDAVATG